MSNKHYTLELELDPPMEVHRVGYVLKPNECPPEPKDYVTIKASSEDKECLEWFLNLVEDRIAMSWGIKEEENE